MGKIDTHHHYFPKVYVDAVGWDMLAKAMPNGKAPSWSVEAALEMMEENGIAQAILSVSAGPRIPDAATLLRKCNDSGTELRSRYPGCFGLFASLPLPDVQASLAEVHYCTEQLGVDGFIVFASYEERYLGDEVFMPLWEELNRKKSLVFVHPSQPPYAIPKVAPASVLEFPFETTRAATSLIISGAVSRFPDLRFILSHAGGTLPFLAPRIALSMSMMPGLIERYGDPMAALGSFYFDTALSAGASTLSALVQVTDPSHILFGSDFPFAPNPAIRRFGQVLDSLSVSGFDRAAVYRGNAQTLLNRDP
jgi:predicted TIM-barrel fold metal-dependent hydrolase